MVDAVPESLGQLFNELSIAEPPLTSGVAGPEPYATSRELAGSDLAVGSRGQPGDSGSQTPPPRTRDRQKRSPRSLALTARPLPPPRPQEKVSQLKEEVRLQYEKLHQLLDEDLRQTVEVLDKAQAKFCSENAAQALHLGERMQEAKKLLGSLQLLFDKTEDVSFMKVGWDRDQPVGSGSFLSRSLPFFAPNQFPPPVCSQGSGASLHGLRTLLCPF